MRLAIDKLSLKNFKGIKNLDIHFMEQDINVYGDNATGKTTIFDAFLWLFFGKDSNNKKDFSIKTIDKFGKEINGVDNEVEAFLFVNSKETKIKRVYKEKYTKKRGSAESEFTGNTTEYFINEVPCKKKEFDEFINSICDEEIFKLLTSPTYFNEQLKWKNKRDILIEVCGDVSDEEVIATNKEFEKLSEVLKGNTISEHLKIVHSQRKKVNEELERIPTRIDESSRSAEEVDIKKIDEAKEELPKIEKEISELSKQKENIEAGDNTAVEMKLRSFEAQKIALENKYEEQKRNKTKDLSEKVSNLYMEKVNQRQKFVLAETKKEKLNEEFEIIKEKLKKGRDKYKEINSKTFKFSEDTICPTCGQNLTEEKIEAARQKAFKSFKERKNNKLSENTEKGKKLVKRQKELDKELEEVTKEYTTYKEKFNQTEAEYIKSEKELETLKSNLSRIEDDKEYVELIEKIDSLKKTLEENKRSSSEVIKKFDKEISELKSKEKDLKNIIATESIIEKSDNRIKELKKQQKHLAKEYEKLESELFLCESFIRAKVELLEDKISSKFKYARFKLFQEQINGGLTECCETTFEGVPYSDLNNAAKINIGLDIINTLSKHYELSAPIFIDNRESVVNLFDIDAQVISLIVSAEDKKIRIEEAA